MMPAFPPPTTQAPQRLIPFHTRGLPPPYFIIAGLVFTPVSVPYLKSGGTCSLLPDAACALSGEPNPAGLCECLCSLGCEPNSCSLCDCPAEYGKEYDFDAPVKLLVRT